MFVGAIERAVEFTRPIHTIFRFFGSTEVHRGAASLFFVNADGWALTCGHVVKQLLAADQLKQRYEAFKAEHAALIGENRRARSWLEGILFKRRRRDQLENELKLKYEFGEGKVVELKTAFVNCVDGPLNITFKLHPTLDVALLRFSDFAALGCTTFPVFGQNGGDLKQGMSLCRLGFPFPEFTNFAYNPSTDTIGWNQQGQQHTPRFPLEGMVTRLLLSAGTVTGFELSTPGLRGQSGGPAFDTQGRVWGMQARTAHLDLNFDVDMEVIRDGSKKRVTDSAFLHVGHCVHVDALKEFMRQHAVTFAEG